MKLRYLCDTLMKSNNKKDEAIIICTEQNKKLKDEIIILKGQIQSKEITINNLKAQIEILKTDILIFKSNVSKQMSLSSQADPNLEEFQPMIKTLLRNQTKNISPINRFTKGMPQVSTFSQAFQDQTEKGLQLSKITNFKTSSTFINKYASKNSVFLDDKEKSMILSYENMDDVMSNEKIYNVRGMLENPEAFKKNIINMDSKEVEETVLSLNSILLDFSLLLSIVQKLRRLYLSSILLCQQLNISEAVEKISDLICSILSCESASVYLNDETSGEIWTRLEKGSRIVRLPLNKGIIGNVAFTGKYENIEEPFHDPRYDEQSDQIHKKRSKNILCVPIKETSGKVLGICVAINKRHGSFTIDDEQILLMLSGFSNYILHNSIVIEQSVPFQYKLRELIQYSYSINQIYELKEFCITVEKVLRDLFNADQSRIYIFTEKRQFMFYIEKTQEWKTYPLGTGIIGDAIYNLKMTSITDCYNHPYFNNLVDLNTTLPIIVLKGVDPDSNNLTIGIEVVNKKGIIGRTKFNRSSVDLVDEEILEYLIKYIVIKYKNIIKNS